MKCIMYCKFIGGETAYRRCLIQLVIVAWIVKWMLSTLDIMLSNVHVRVIVHDCINYLLLLASKVRNASTLWG